MEEHTSPPLMRPSATSIKIIMIILRALMIFLALSVVLNLLSSSVSFPFITFAAADDTQPPPNTAPPNVTNVFSETGSLRYVLGPYTVPIVDSESTYSGFKKSNFNWVIRNVTLLQGKIDITVHRDNAAGEDTSDAVNTDDNGPLADSHVTCLRNVNILLEDVVVSQGVTITVRTCMLNSTITLRNVRSTNITRYRVYSHTAGDDNGDADIDDGNTFKINLNFFGDVFGEYNFKIMNSTITMDRIVGAAINEEGRVVNTPIKIAERINTAEGDEVISNATMARAYFRRPYVMMPGSAVRSPLISIQMSGVEAHNVTIAVTNVRQTQYGPWRYIQPRLFLLSFLQQSSWIQSKLYVRNIISSSRFIYEHLNAGFTPTGGKTVTFEENLTTSLGPLFVTEGADAVAKLVATSMADVAASNAFNEDVRLVHINFSGLAKLSQSLIAIEGVRVNWHKSVVMSLFNTMDPLKTSVMRSNFPTPYGRAMVLIGIGLYRGNPTESDADLYFTNNRIQISNVRFNFVDFRSMLEKDSATSADGIGGPTNTYGITATTVENAKAIDNAVYIAPTNATEVNIVAVDLDCKSKGWVFGEDGPSESSVTPKTNNRVVIFNIAVNATRRPSSIRYEAFPATTTPITVGTEGAALPSSVDAAEGGIQYERFVEEAVAPASTNLSPQQTLATYQDDGNNRTASYALAVGARREGFVMINVRQTFVEGIALTHFEFYYNFILCTSAWSCSGIVTRVWAVKMTPPRAVRARAASLGGVLGIGQSSVEYSTALKRLTNIDGLDDPVTTLDIRQSDAAVANRHASTRIGPESNTIPTAMALSDDALRQQVSFTVLNVFCVGGLWRSQGVAFYVNHVDTIVQGLNVSIRNVTVLKQTLMSQGTNDVGVLISVTGSATINSSSFVITDVFTNATASPIIITLKQNATIANSVFNISCERSRNRNRIPSYDAMMANYGLSSGIASDVGPGDFRYASPLYTNQYNSNRFSQLYQWDLLDDAYVNGGASDTALYDRPQRFTEKAEAYALFAIGGEPSPSDAPPLGGGKLPTDARMVNRGPVTFLGNKVTVADIVSRGAGATVVAVAIPVERLDSADTFEGYVPFQPVSFGDNFSANDEFIAESIVSGNRFDMAHLRCVSSFECSTSRVQLVSLPVPIGTTNPFAVSTVPPNFYAENTFQTVRFSNNTMASRDIEVSNSVSSYGSIYNLGTCQRSLLHNNTMTADRYRMVNVVHGVSLSFAGLVVSGNALLATRFHSWGERNTHVGLDTHGGAHYNNSYTVRGVQHVMSIENPTRLSLLVSFAALDFQVAFTTMAAGRPLPTFVGDSITASDVTVRTRYVSGGNATLGEVYALKFVPGAPYLQFNSCRIEVSDVTYAGPITYEKGNAALGESSLALNTPRVAVMGLFGVLRTKISFDQSAFVVSRVTLLEVYYGMAVCLQTDGALNNLTRNAMVVSDIFVGATSLRDELYIGDDNDGGEKSAAETIGVVVQFSSGSRVIGNNFTFQNVSAFRYANGIYFASIKPPAGSGPNQMVGTAVWLDLGTDRCVPTAAMDCTLDFSRNSFVAGNLSACGYGLKMETYSETRMNENYFTAKSIHMNHTNGRCAVQLSANGRTIMRGTFFDVDDVSIVNGMPSLNSAVVSFALHGTSQLYPPDSDLITPTTRRTVQIRNVRRWTDVAALAGFAGYKQYIYDFLHPNFVAGVYMAVAAVHFSIAGQTAQQHSTSVEIHNVSSRCFASPIFNVSSVAVYMTISPSELVTNPQQVVNNKFYIQNIISDGYGVYLFVDATQFLENTFDTYNITSTMGTALGIYPLRTFVIFFYRSCVVTNNIFTIVNVHNVGYDERRVLTTAEAEGPNAAAVIDEKGGAEAVYIFASARGSMYHVSGNTFSFNHITSLSSCFNSPAILINITGLGNFTKNTITAKNVANKQPINAVPRSYAHYAAFAADGSMLFGGEAAGEGARPPAAAFYLAVSPEQNVLTDQPAGLGFNENALQLEDIYAVHHYNGTTAGTDASLGSDDDDLVALDAVRLARAQLAVRVVQVPARIPHTAEQFPYISAYPSITTVGWGTITLQRIAGGVEFDLGRAESMTINVLNVTSPIFGYKGKRPRFGDVGRYTAENPPLFPSINPNIGGATWVGDPPPIPSHLSFVESISAMVYRGDEKDLWDRLAAAGTGGDAAGAAMLVPLPSAGIDDAAYRRRNLPPRWMVLHRAPITITMTLRNARITLTDVNTNSTVVVRHSRRLFELMRAYEQPTVGTSGLSPLNYAGTLVTNVGTAATINIMQSSLVGGLYVIAALESAGVNCNSVRVERHEDLIQQFSIIPDSGGDRYGVDYFYDASGAEHSVAAVGSADAVAALVQARFDHYLLYTLTTIAGEGGENGVDEDEDSPTHDSLLSSNHTKATITLRNVMNTTLIGRDSLYIGGAIGRSSSVGLRRVTVPRLVLAADAHQCLPPSDSRPLVNNTKTIAACLVLMRFVIANATFVEGSLAEAMARRRIVWEMIAGMGAIGASRTSSVDATAGGWSDGLEERQRGGGTESSSPNSIATPPYVSALLINASMGDGLYVMVGDCRLIGHSPRTFAGLMGNITVSGVSSTVVGSVVSIKNRLVPLFDMELNRNYHSTATAPPRAYAYGDYAYTTAADPSSIIGRDVLQGYGLSISSTVVSADGLAGYATGERRHGASGGGAWCTVAEALRRQQNGTEAFLRKCAPSTASTTVAAADSSLFTLRVAALTVVDHPLTTMGLKSLELWGNYLDPMACRGGVQLKLHHVENTTEVLQPLELDTDDPPPPHMLPLPLRYVPNATMLTVVQNTAGFINITSAWREEGAGGPSGWAAGTNHTNDYGANGALAAGGFFERGRGFGGSLQRYDEAVPAIGSDDWIVQQRMLSRRFPSPNRDSTTRRWGCNLIALPHPSNDDGTALGLLTAEGLVHLLLDNDGQQSNNNALSMGSPLVGQLNATLAYHFGRIGGLYPCGMARNRRSDTAATSNAMVNTPLTALDYNLTLHPMVALGAGGSDDDDEGAAATMGSGNNRGLLPPLDDARAKLFTTLYMGGNVENPMSTPASVGTVPAHPSRIIRCHEKSNVKGEDPTSPAYGQAPPTTIYRSGATGRYESLFLGQVGGLQKRVTAHTANQAIGYVFPFDNALTDPMGVGSSDTHRQAANTAPATRLDQCNLIQINANWRPHTYTMEQTLAGDRTNTLAWSTSSSRGATRAKQLSQTVSTTVVMTSSVSDASASVEFLRVYVPIPAVVKMADNTATVAGGIVSSVALVGGVTGAGQLGVANAMTRLASCDDEDEDPDEGLPILVHPLQFTLFEGNGTLRGAYAASLIGNCLIIPTAITLLVHGPLQLIIRFVKGGAMGRDEALAEIGWPSVLIMPFSTLAEGIGVGLVRSFRRDDDDSASQQTISVGVGCIGALVLAMFVASWVFMLAKKMPRRKVSLKKEQIGSPHQGRDVKKAHHDEGVTVDGDAGEEMQQSTLEVPLVHTDGSDGDDGEEGFASSERRDDAHSTAGPPRKRLRRAQHHRPEETRLLTLGYWVNPTHRWEPLTTQELRSVSGGGDRAASPASLGPIPEADMERFGSAVGDSRLFYAELTSCVCSLIVGFAEGVPATHCRPRAVVALIAAVLQCGCSVMTVVPVELALQALLAVCIVPLSFAVTAKVFMDGDSDDADGDGVGDLLSSADSAIAALSVVGNFVGILLMVVGLGRGLWGMATSYRTNKETPHQRPASLRRHGLVDDALDDVALEEVVVGADNEDAHLVVVDSVDVSLATPPRRDSVQQQPPFAAVSDDLDLLLSSGDAKSRQRDATLVSNAAALSINNSGPLPSSTPPHPPQPNAHVGKAIRLGGRLHNNNADGGDVYHSHSSLHSAPSSASPSSMYGSSAASFGYYQDSRTVRQREDDAILALVEREEAARARRRRSFGE